MAETFSLSVTGIDSNTRYTPKTLQVGDTDIASNVVGPLAGAQAGLMSRGGQVLCKQPDGSLAYYVPDPIRSIPGVSLVMMKV